MENTQVCGGGEEREKGASAARKRSDVRYRQQRDAGDTTSDGERWKVTGRRGEGRRGCAEMEFRGGWGEQRRWRRRRRAEAGRKTDYKRWRKRAEQSDSPDRP